MARLTYAQLKGMKLNQECSDGGARLHLSPPGRLKAPALGTPLSSP
jgi:hypothetical protein